MKLRDLNGWKRKHKELPLIVATDFEAARIGADMVREGRAYGCVFVEDGPGGRVDVRYIVGPGHEHRLADIDAMVAKVADSMGSVAVDPMLLTKRGEA